MSPLSVLPSLGSQGVAKAAARKEAVLFQGFGWESHKHEEGWWRHVKARVPDLKKAGCTHLWLPPPSQSVSPQVPAPPRLAAMQAGPAAARAQQQQQPGRPHPTGYMPGQLYNLDASKYGNKDDLRGERIDWGSWAITSNDPTFRGSGNADTGADYAAAPDLDHANPALRKALTEWLAWLQDHVGFGGWRLDFVKGYGAEFVDEYISKTVGRDALNVGEYWVDMSWNGSELAVNQDGARQALCNWIDANKMSSAAFDFPTKGILQEAVGKTQYWRLRDGQGKAPGLLGWWPEQAVTFTDNHDTGSSQQHWPFPGHLMGAGYAHVLTHPGMPCVFWEHYFDWGHELRETIDKLVQLRKRNNVLSDSKLEIKAAHHDLYFAVVDARVAVKLGPRMELGPLQPSKDQGWVVAASGKDFCVWEKSAGGRE
ncbi:hypothetical protein MNEG_4284 [Monoraphidium neglectum]|uniref:alpha-amylase n=1 Tax=Monoraphidium neglectum TaxID=145388 RepID=A0A0D2LA94_9CHLO|nr:hypothetical protein MNEG_4284 [Monoraphidium neglectum]KIZ03679.1 hypothetical protein MNEG_4284 [Monoraphidium neglectum]|eukprot:XP_013902698.1 hypothetical protein MNEG_4284 [Monoraphidium neglectum]